MNWNRVFVRSVLDLGHVKVFVKKNVVPNLLYPSFVWTSWSSNAASWMPSGGTRSYSSKSYNSDNQRIESYFSAIGGDSEKPPPDLTPGQVSDQNLAAYLV